MADHNTNIGGVTGEIDGMTVNIGGVVREVESGIVLVGGVAREITFASAKMCVVTIVPIGNYDASYNKKDHAYVTINGKRYTSSATIEVPEGTQVICFVKSTGAGNATIKLNDTVVKSVKRASAEYTHTVTKNTRYELSAPFTDEIDSGNVYIIEE